MGGPLITDIANILVGVLSIIVVIMGFVIKGIYKTMDQKCNKETCAQKHKQVEQKHEQFDKELTRGDAKFSQLLSEMTQFREILNKGMNDTNNSLNLLSQRVQALDGGRLGRRVDDVTAGN